MIVIRATRLQESGFVEVEVDKFPDGCPVCHHAIEARPKNVAHNIERSSPSEGKLEIVFQCPRLACQSLFISRYATKFNMRSDYFHYRGSAPFSPVETDFDEHISAISPQFCTIFNESQNAERQGWKLIAGPGYRKALEFLVKDYLCHSIPTKATEIKQLQLGPCIETYVDNDKIKQMAKRAAWLGNDETHYIRKWEDKDLEDLKKTLELTVHWISMEELTKSVLTAMPKGKP
jgi:hypothetical protein